MPKGVFSRDENWKQNVSDKLRGRKRTDEQRARIHAGKKYSEQTQPDEYVAAYERYLKRLRALRELDEE